MPVIKINDQQYALRPGPNRVGAGTDVDVRVDENPALGVQAIVDVTSDSRAVIRRAGNGAAVRVNGVPLVDPTPLIHGDRVEIAGRELLFADDTKAGATQFVSAKEIAALAQKRPSPSRATAATGGRLISLVDGKEYVIPDSGITIGRDAGSGVVIAHNEVSRRHAEVVPVEGGYELRDFSANGVYVNGARVDNALILSRADVIRIGTEEFRFYADLAGGRAAGPGATPVISMTPPIPMTPVRPAAAAASAPPDAPPAASAVPPAATAASQLPTSPAIAASELPTPPAAPAAKSTAPVLATLEVTNAGPTRGTSYEIRVPLSHIGRGAHNDVVIADDSVSDTHAKIQRREDGWFLVDVGSTNGTYVGGQRITTERRLDGEPDVRFGGVKMVFRPKSATGSTNTGTRAIASVDRSKLRPAAAAAPAPRAPQQTASVAPAESRNALPGWVWGVVVLAIGAVAAFFLLNR
jgi:pSer/pThr/pTyr-binding forkhead associated (FHA) protein